MKRAGAAAAFAAALLVPVAAFAAKADGAAAGTRSVGFVLVLAALSLVPFLLLMTTAFVKVSVVLSILRSAVGTPQVPPTAVVTGLALILTLFIMAPTGRRTYEALEPGLATVATADVGTVEGAQVLARAADGAKEPLRDFLLKQTDRRDRATFFGLAARMRPEARRAEVTDRDLEVLVPAFVTSELRRAFEIGFLLFLPFLVLDLVIANLLSALGMHMLSPTTVSLPFKLLLFVLADGWHLVTRGLVESYLR